MAYSQLSYDPWEITPQERKARFVGREGLLHQILGAIAEQQEHFTVQHYLLLGPRGIGKTTLLLTLRDTIREDRALSARWLCVQLREEEYFVRTLRDLLELTLQSLADDEELPGAEEVARRVRQEPKEERSLALAVDGLRALASRQGKRILLLIDNFDRVFPATATGREKKRPPENEFRAFRKLLSTESFLMVVGASVRLFQEIAAYDRAFFNFFSPIEVPDLSDDEICQLLRRCAEAEGNTNFLAQFDAIRNKVRAITFTTGGNPRLVLMLYDVLRHREMTPVVQALRETVGGLTPLLKHILDDMPRQQSKTLDALMRLWGAAPPNRIAEMARLPLNVVTAQLGRLKESRFVASEGDGKGKPATYRISDPMFQTWYQMRYLRPAARRVELFVEFIRAWFSVEERRQFLNEQWGALGSGGKRGAFQECGLAIQYYAAAMEDEGERRGHFERLADTFAEAGREREAAMLLAESVGSAGLTGRRYEAEGYRQLGVRSLQKGDPEKAIAAFRRALKKESGNIDAILGLGISLAAAGEHALASEEFERVTRTSGASVQQIAWALINRGFTKRALGDSQGAVADYTAAVELPGAPAEQVAWALVNRGVTKGALDDSLGAVGDYTAVVELPRAPAEQVAWALVNRGITKGVLGDGQGSAADYTAVVELLGAPAEQVARALFNRGVTKGALGDSQGEIADYTAVVELLGAPVEQVARALVNRGITKRALDDSQGAVADYTAVVELPRAPAEQIARALFNRGVTKGALGDSQGEIADYTAVVELLGAPAEQVARALFNRGVTKGALGDSQGEVADYTAVVELPGAPGQQVAMALLNCGVRKGALGDSQGEIADYTAVVELPGAPAEQVAKALFNLGSTKGALGDRQGAVADYMAVVELPGAPAEQVAKALINRGHTKGALGDGEGEVADYTAVVELPGAPSKHVADALFNRGTWLWNAGEIDRALRDYESALEIPGISDAQRSLALRVSGTTLIALGKSADAIARFEEALELRASADTVYAAFAILVFAHVLNNQSEQAARWVARLHEFELVETPIEQRLEARINAILNAGRSHGPETAELLLNAALRGAPDNIRARLEFLSPAIQYAKTGDEQALARLPEPEREAAKKIAASILEKNGVSAASAARPSV